MKRIRKILCGVLIFALLLSTVALASGKIKTTVSLVGLCLMMTPWHDFVLFGKFDIDWLVVVLMLVTTVWSGVEYFIKNGKLLNLKK